VLHLWVPVSKSCSSYSVPEDLTRSSTAVAPLLGVTAAITGRDRMCCWRLKEAVGQLAAWSFVAGGLNGCWCIFWGTCGMGAAKRQLLQLTSGPAAAHT
jgi:hypothetical protein